MKSNNELISDLKCDCNFAFGELYIKNFEMVLRYIERNNGNRQDAEDIFQDTMLVLCKKLRTDEFTLTASLKTYVMAIAKNLWLKNLSNAKKKRDGEKDISDEFNDNITETVESEFSTWEKLHYYIEKISLRCVQLIRDVFFNHKTIEEIQSDYGYKNIHTAQNLKHKCINQIKRVKAKDER